MENSKSKSTIVLAGVFTAGLVALVAMAVRQRRNVSSFASRPLRDIQSVLSDCYSKIREIEETLPDLTRHLPGARSN